MTLVSKKKIARSVVLTVSALTLSQCLYAQSIPFRVETGLFDLKNQTTCGLERPEGLLNKDVYVPGQHEDAIIANPFFLIWYHFPPL